MMIAVKNNRQKYFLEGLIMKKRVFALLLSTAMVTSMLAGCSGKSQTEATAAKETDKVQTSAAEKGRMWKKCCSPSLTVMRERILTENLFTSTRKSIWLKIPM